MGAEEQADSLDEEEVGIVKEIEEVIERGRKDVTRCQKCAKEEIIRRDLSRLILSTFKTHTITKTNELFYVGDAVVTNRLGVKIDKVERNHWEK